MKMFWNRKAEGWALPSIFGVVGLALLIGWFIGLGFWWGLLGFILVVVAIWPYK